jgi:cell division protein FtsN
MASRDSQSVVLSRQAILLVPAVGVGLLTLCFVIGVQVGKQSAALRHPAARGGEDLVELPASVEEQLKAFERKGPAAAAGQARPAVPAKAETAALAAEPAKPEAARPEAAKPVLDKKTEAAPDRKVEAAVMWTLQVGSTPDPAEAQRMAAKAKGAGFPTATVAEKGLYKVRLTQSGPRETMDTVAQKLKNRGFKPFAVKLE